MTHSYVPLYSLIELPQKQSYLKAMKLESLRVTSIFRELNSLAAYLQSLLSRIMDLNLKVVDMSAVQTILLCTLFLSEWVNIGYDTQEYG